MSETFILGFEIVSVLFALFDFFYAYKSYRQAEEIRRKEKDYDLWLQGRYFYDALCAVSPLLHAFAKNGTQAEKYIADPYPRTMKDYKELQEKQMKERAEAFAAFVDAKNRERREKNG